MKFLIEFGFTPEAAILTTSGVARVADFRNMSEALVEHPRFQTGMPILIDHTSLDASVLTPTDVRTIGEFVATIGDRLGPSSIAVVVPDKLTFGFVRMGEMRANQPQLNVKIFYSLAEAVQWLQKPVLRTPRMIVASIRIPPPLAPDPSAPSRGLSAVGGLVSPRPPPLTNV